MPTRDHSFGDLRPTSWAVLGLLMWGDELSGYDLKKWADYSIRFFFWSPSFSQVYSELKKLEAAGYVSSRSIVQDAGRVKPKRLYRITEQGLQVLEEWSEHAPIERPVLKHGIMLRVFLGALNEPERLKTIVRAHIAESEGLRRQASLDAQDTADDPEWAFQHLALEWAQRYYASERDLATELLDRIDETYERAREGTAPGQPPVPRPGSKRGIAKRPNTAEYEAAAHVDLDETPRTQGE